MKQIQLFHSPIHNEIPKKEKINNLTQIGSTTHANNEREMNDFYATPSSAIENFLHCYLVRDKNKLQKNVWEPACGNGQISEAIKEYGYHVTSTDLIDRGYGTRKDFLSFSHNYGKGDIITNPPFKIINEFMQKGMDLLENGQKMILLMRLLCLEGKTRNTFFQKYPIQFVYVHTTRIACHKPNEEKPTTAMAYAWYVWEKGFKGDTVVRWLP